MKPQYIEIGENGGKYYFSDRKLKILHREDGPAIEYADGTKVWFRNGQHHREDGPAIEYSDGSKSWYIDGSFLTEDQFKSRTAPHNGKKVTVDSVEYTLKA